MTFLQPLGLIALLVLPLIVLVHALRPRFRILTISSLLLWPEFDASVAARRRWQRPRLSRSLILQLLIAALVALAIAQPAIARDRPRHLALVIDDSPVMQATDVEPSRIAAARAAAELRLRDLSGDAAVTVVRARARPEIVRQAGDAAAARAALDTLTADPPATGRAAPADLGAAVELAGAAIRSAPGRSNEILVLTGSRLDGRQLSDPNARVEVQTFGAGGPNVGIAAFDVRRPPGEAIARGYARVVNETDQPVATRLGLTADRVPVERLPIDLAAGGEGEVVFSLPAGTREVVGRIDPVATDRLPADDRSGAVVGNVRRDVLLVGAGGQALEHGFAVLPGVAVRPVGLGQYPSEVDNVRRADARTTSRIFTLVGWLPDRPPPGPLLILAPPTGSDWLPVGDTASLSRLARQDRAGPILRGLDLSPVGFGTFYPTALPAWAAADVEAENGPLVYHGLLDGRRVVVWAFDPARTNLPKLPAFPILLANSLDWLLPESEEGSATARPAGVNPRPESAPMPVEPTVALEPERLIPGDWWRWLALGALAIAAIEWWRYARGAT